jgi:hypothetical protein
MPRFTLTSLPYAAGGPFNFTVADPENVMVSGNGIDLVRCNRVSSFVITSPAAKSSDLHVKITGKHAPLYQPNLCGLNVNILYKNFKLSVTNGLQ